VNVVTLDESIIDPPRLTENEMYKSQLYSHSAVSRIGLTKNGKVNRTKSILFFDTEFNSKKCIFRVIFFLCIKNYYRKYISALGWNYELYYVLRLGLTGV